MMDGNGNVHPSLILRGGKQDSAIEIRKNQLAIIKYRIQKLTETELKKMSCDNL